MYSQHYFLRTNDTDDSSSGKISAPTQSDTPTENPGSSLDPVQEPSNPSEKLCWEGFISPIEDISTQNNVLAVSKDTVNVEHNNNEDEVNDNNNEDPVHFYLFLLEQFLMKYSPTFLAHPFLRLLRYISIAAKTAEILPWHRTHIFCTSPKRLSCRPSLSVSSSVYFFCLLYLSAWASTYMASP